LLGLESLEAVEGLERAGERARCFGDGVLNGPFWS
jgi:hypothetical protein